MRILSTHARSSVALLLGLLAVTACTPKDKDNDSSGGKTTVSTATTAVSSPEITSIATRLPNTPIRLAQWLDVTTSVPTTVQISWTDGDHTGTHFSTTFAETQSLPVLGLRPGRHYLLTAIASNEAGQQSEPITVSFATAPLPDDFPQMAVLSHDRAAMEPGYTLLDLNPKEGTSHYLVVLDADLEVVWMSTLSWEDVRLTPWGTLMGGHQRGVLEIDFMGREIHRWSSQDTPNVIQVEPSYLHHEVIPLAEGGFLSLTNGIWPMTDYPASYTDPNDTQAGNVKSPVIIQISEDGDTVMEVDIGDIVDRHRIGFDSLSLEGGLLDWAHGNALLQHQDGGYIVSLRHQNALVKLDSNGDLEWILGDPGGWTAQYQPYLFQPIGDDFSWFYHQHGPELAPNGDLLLFDNHNDGYTPYGTAPGNPIIASRVVRYHIDEQARTVELLGSWHDFGAGSPIFSAALGDADALPQTENILSVFGFANGEEFIPNEVLGFGDRTSHIIEFHPDNPSNPAMHVRFYSDKEVFAGGWKSYRAEHIDALVPPL